MKTCRRFDQSCVRRRKAIIGSPRFYLKSSRAHHFRWTESC